MPLTKSKKEKIIESAAKIYRERSNIKSKRVCALTETNGDTVRAAVEKLYSPTVPVPVHPAHENVLQFR